MPSSMFERYDPRNWPISYEGLLHTALVLTTAVVLVLPGRLTLGRLSLLPALSFWIPVTAAMATVQTLGEVEAVGTLTSGCLCAIGVEVCFWLYVGYRTFESGMLKE